MNAMAIHRMPQEDRAGRALMLALAVHLALIAFLWVGVRWQNEPAVAEAEVWDIQARDAAPRPVAQPEPVTPPPAVKAPVEPEPKPVQRETPKPPDIALEPEKKRKVAEQKELERREKIEQVKREKQAKQEQARLEKAEKDKLAKLKAAEQKRLDAQHTANLRQLQEAAGSGGSGNATKSTGSRDGSYQQKIMTKIKSNTAFAVPPGLAGNPAVEYAVELLPDGSLRSAPRKLKSSGVPGFDEASLRAIEKSAPFPADRYGKVPASLKIIHKPKE